MRTALEQYQQGLATYLEVLDAQRSVDGLQDEVAPRSGAQSQAFIGIYKALGGGW